jgi:hypothetical protein
MTLLLVAFLGLYIFVSYKILTYTLGVINTLDYPDKETKQVHTLEAVVIGLLWPIFFYVLILFLRRARDV